MRPGILSCLIVSASLTSCLAQTPSPQTPSTQTPATRIPPNPTPPIHTPVAPAAQSPAPPSRPTSFDVKAMDASVDPCVDFYQYACGNWKKSNPVPADQTAWGRFNELSEWNLYSLYSDLKQAADAPRTPLQTKYGNYFAACMNVDLANRLGAQPLAPELAGIEAIRDKKQIAKFDVEAARQFGGSLLFDLGVVQDQKDASRQILATSQGGLSLPDRDYYLLDDARYTKLREQYLANMVKTFELLNDTPEQAAAEAGDVLRVETAMAKGEMSRVEMRDPENRYHILSVTDLQALSPEYDWHTLLQGNNVAQAKTIDVMSPGFVKAVNAEINSESLDAIKHYLRWHAIHQVASLLSDPFAKTNFDFFGATLNGQEQQTPRWKRCTRESDSALGEAVGQDWVKQNFPPSAKANMENLVTALDKALAEDIRSLTWMTEPTKKQAEAKLAVMERKIGYPEHWRDYSALITKRDDPVGNFQRAQQFENRRDLNKLGKPVDKTEWDMTPPTVNAYYMPSQVNINFPAGILQPPFYDDKIDPAVNFGAIGVVIGHEMTHGFDDEGAKYDLHGNVSNWFTPDDLKQFNDRTKCIADEYSGFEVAPGQNLNGSLTLGENTADNGGLRIAFRALQETLAAEGAKNEPDYTDGKRDGFTPEQRYFIAYGQVWCQNVREPAARVRAKTDPHSSGQWRVNGAVQNFEEFGKAFSCKQGQPMMPANSCRVW